MKPTNKQIELSNFLGLDIDANDTYRTVAARIYDSISEAIDEKPCVPATEGQIELAEKLGVEFRNDTSRTLYAKNADKLESIRLQALEELNIRRGSVVQVIDGIGIVRERVVSTVKDNGRIYFKGANCPVAWSNEIVKVIEN
jgi:hypothetical protein